MNGDFTVVEGRLCLSKTGRDKGRLYMIVAKEGTDRVQLCDGKRRPLANPKSKKLKHIRLLPVCDESIVAALQDNKPIYDQTICEALLRYEENRS